MKYSFFDDYTEGAHPEIISAISQNNLDQQTGYCNDDYCMKAAELIKQQFSVENSDVHFLPNGTIANVVGLVSMLKSFEGVIAPTTGHINVHEAGALEAAGRKILAIPTQDGKLRPEHIDQALETYEDEHTVSPRVVYLTQATETGTVYTLDELKTVVNYAKEKNLYTYLDGARLAMGIASKNSKMTTNDIGSIGLDMFYIGGTKNGGIYGEAVVVNNEIFKSDFRAHMKQRGALMAKGRFIGQQFVRFFEDDNLWLTLAEQANGLAGHLSSGLAELGVEFETDTDSNQVFPTLSNSLIENLEKEYGFYRIKKIDAENTQIRLVCSWATTINAVDEFLDRTKELIAQ